MPDGKIEDIEVEKIKPKPEVPGQEFDPKKAGAYAIPEKRETQAIGQQPPPQPLEEKLPVYKPNPPKEDLPESEIPISTSQQTPPKTGNIFSNIVNKILRRG